MGRVGVLVVLLTSLPLYCCGDKRRRTPPPASSTAGATSSSTGGVTSHTLPSGTLQVLTYNVAGLPQGLSGSSPLVNTPQISPLLNNYELVLVQEDFTYHPELSRDARHPYQSVPQRQMGTVMHDGLNRFSNTPYVDFVRTTWQACNGYFDHENDCLASKGFTVARHLVAPGVQIDVYNIHSDAGRAGSDIDTRVRQFAQLRDFIRGYSANRAVIVAGDTNLKMRTSRDVQTLADFLGGLGLQDSARVLGMPEEIDRVMFRGTPDLIIVPKRWREADEFVDSSGSRLSDHDAIHVELEWRVTR